jgi:tetratricopeptide (TPR) repeat protein
VIATLLHAAIALAVSGAPAASQATSTPADPTPLAEVRRQINAGDAAGALRALQSLPRGTDPARDLHASLLEGVAHYHEGDAARAVQILAPIVDRLPSDSLERREAEQVLGLASFLIGRYADAVPRLEATHRWAPDNPELSYALGQAYVQTRRGDDARRVFAGVYRVPPDSAAAHLLTAQMMIRSQFEAAAEGELTAALAKDPRLPGANLLLGQIALFRGRFPEAIALTERELAINPANAMALSQLGDALVRGGQWDPAIAALQRSVWLNPYYSAPYILLGRAYLKKEQPSAAEGMLRRAIQYDPNNRAAHYLLAQLLEGTGRSEEAAREFAIAERLSGTRAP